ncbi:MAG: hypothetical protein EOQ42_03570 [Mesorhizobium sp.]|nr:MAG: hypothetical protein EOQ43_12115 [Mesorhizobium sp.]TGU00690.1 hypothetical protein EN807_13080 [Mesorhizobium sp. M5C.F.Ca.ET.164.01.1.1]RWB80908.1 MAG: hypothetical protein EOQ42_03570 [Mesorhizobium sp.]RWC24853.1 MAG: hypothetical protein EOS51_02470 [Mesorhizobium sp.]RWD20824.1 MAG: hypothetical protein EOS57_07855 [Mesorhizobium sp.]
MIPIDDVCRDYFFHLTPTKLIRKISARLGEAFPVVALKAGAGGAWLKMFGTLLQRGSKKVPDVDTTGAGDAFNTGFIHAWLSGENAQTCLAAGVTFGSLAVQAAGGTAILRDPEQGLIT